MLKQKRKHNLSNNLSENKVFWNQLVKDAEAKIAEAKRRIKQLETARMTFEENAANDIPMPGTTSGDTSESPFAHDAATRN
jgi:hypothetical protein